MLKVENLYAETYGEPVANTESVVDIDDVRISMQDGTMTCQFKYNNTKAIQIQNENTQVWRSTGKHVAWKEEVEIEAFWKQKQLKIRNWPKSGRQYNIA